MNGTPKVSFHQLVGHIYDAGHGFAATSVCPSLQVRYVKVEVRYLKVNNGNNVCSTSELEAYSTLNLSSLEVYMYEHNIPSDLTKVIRSHQHDSSTSSPSEQIAATFRS